MPITPTYPGVYIQELASDVRTIVPVDTATTAFIGQALRGPVNQPVTIFGFDEFERIFGGLWVESRLGYAVSDFFLNGGGKAIVVRAFWDNPTPSAPGMLPSQPALLALSSPATAPSGARASLPDLKTAAELKTAEWQAKEQAAKALEDLRDLMEDQVEMLRQKQGTSKSSELSRVSKEAAEAKSLAEKAREEAKQAKEDAGKANKAYTDVLATAMPQLEAASKGDWGNQLALRVTKEKDGDDNVLKNLAGQYGVKKEDLFNLTIRDRKTGAEEYYPNVTLTEGPRRLDKVLEAQSQLVRVSGDALAKYTGSAPEPHAKLPDDKPDWWNDKQYCSMVETHVGDGSYRRDDVKVAQTIKDALHALDHVDIFNMLCIPPYAGDDVPGGVLAEATKYCEDRRAMLIVDSPSAWTSWSDAKGNFPIKELAPSANAAIFFPRLRKRNPLRDNQVEEFVPCGAVAGVMARTDFRRGVWKAAAGLEATLNGVAGFAVPIDDNANGQLNPIGINCLRVVPGAGPVIWGARTMVGDDRLANQWKYIPVRRMALWIEETLYRSTQWAVFEPNDEPLWSSLRLNIGNFMNGLFRQGAFQGKTPAEAYFVRCDATTTTQTDIDRGIVNVVVGFAPLKPAEFVIISIKQITNQGAAA